MRFRLLGLLSFVFAGLASAQVVKHRVDDFQDGTTMQWGGGSSPTNIANGGPLGAGDRYLQISAAGGFLATFNITRWNGSYPIAGVDRVEADVRNTGPNPLVIRLILFQSNFDRWSSNVSFSLPANSGWTHVAFDLAEANFTHTIGTASWATMMGAMDRIMFRHEPVISSGGSAVTGTLGIDNVVGNCKINDVAPSSFNITMGILSGGGLADLASSNDGYLTVRQNPFRSRQDPAVRVEFGATTPPGAFDTLELTLEASTTAVPATSLSQRIEVWNYANSTWDLVDTRPASGTDLVTLVTINDPNPYINPANGAMLARALYMDPGTLLTRSWTVSFDQVRWRLTR